MNIPLRNRYKYKMIYIDLYGIKTGWRRHERWRRLHEQRQFRAAQTLRRDVDQRGQAARATDGGGGGRGSGQSTRRRARGRRRAQTRALAAASSHAEASWWWWWWWCRHACWRRTSSQVGSATHGRPRRRTRTTGSSRTRLRRLLSRAVQEEHEVLAQLQDQDRLAIF